MHDDRLESLLRGADPADSLPALGSREIAASVRTRHAAVQRRRRITQRALGAAVIYMAGMVTMWCWDNVSSTQTGVEWPATVQQLPTHDAAIEERESEEGTDPRSLNAHTTMAASPYQTLRALGDRYLLEQGKVEFAVGAYSRALEHASPAEREIAYEDDSWLLISLKRDRLVSSL